MTEIKKTFKLPKSLAACADRMFDVQTARRAKQKEADALEEEEKYIKAYLIDNIPKSDASGVAGKKCRVTVVRKEVPQVEDREALNKYILKTKDLSLLQARLNDSAIKERWENGKQVPGVKAFPVITLSINKV